MSGWPAGLRFRPIQQWPGELSRSRRRSPFEATLGATQDLLTRELRALSAKTVVIQLAIGETDLRNDGLPRASARPEHPGVILSLESPYGPLSYPCDTFTDWQSNLRGIALALEALRKVDRYGVTKNGEQYRGWRQLGSGAAPSSGKMTVAEARAFMAQHGDYRTAARKLHPDAGGSAEEFQRLQEARRVLEAAR